MILPTSLWIVFVAFSLAGVQFTYSIQFACGTPLFHDKLGFDSQTIGLILATAGPISGFLVQPIIGVISDNSESKFGRRRPFILVGSIFCALGMALIAWCSKIEEFLDSTNIYKSKDHFVGRVLAIIGFWIMNLFVNVVQGPARTVVNDVVGESNLQSANSLIGFVMGISAVIATIIGAQFIPINQTDDIPDFQKEPYFYLFMLGVVFVLISTIPTLLAAKEIPYQREPGKEKPNILSVFVQIFRAFRSMPFEMTKVVMLFFFSWSAFTPLLYYQSQFYSQVVFLNQSYGLKIGMYSLALFNTVLLAFSLTAAQLGKKIGIKTLYFITQVLATVCYILIPIIEKIPLEYKPYFALFVTTLVAFNFQAFNSIPFALVVEITGGVNSGLYMGVLNSAAVVAQTLTSTIISFTIFAFFKDNWSLAIGCGAVTSLIACILVFTISTKSRVTELTGLNDEDKRLIN